MTTESTSFPREGSFIKRFPPGYSLDEDEDATVCCDCDCELAEGEIYEYRGEIYCEDCVPSYICEGCGEWHLGECYTELDGHELCGACNGDYDVCSSCGSFASCSQLYYSEVQDAHYCESCYADRFTLCEACGYEIDTSHDHYLTNGGDAYCESCADELRGSLSEYIHGYDYKPHPLFHGVGNVYYGLELETDKYEDVKEASEAIYENAQDGHENDLYQKEDGSLNDGIELVFHPRTITSWRDYQADLNLITRTARAQGGRSFNTRTCGVHVHRSRKDLSELTLAKLVAFFATCQPQITRVAQRISNTFASFESFTGVAHDRLITYKFIKDGKANLARYQAINFKNRNTIEFRIFRGSLKTETILNYISFCHYVVEFCKVSLLAPFYRESDTTWGRFVDYLKGRVTKEVNASSLMDYLQAKRLA